MNKKRLALAIVVFSIAGFISSTTRSSWGSGGLILELDAEIPHLVGDYFNIKVTAFDRFNSSVTLVVLFDATDQYKVFEDTRAYFVNQLINCSTRGPNIFLESGRDHNITILVRNDRGDSRAITQDIEIDRTKPTVNYFQVTEFSTDENNEQFVGYGDTVMLHWKVADEHFLQIFIYQDNKIDESSGSKEGTYRMSFNLPSEAREKTFEVYLVVEDQSGNTQRSESYFIRYVDERIYQEPADSQKERNLAFWGSITGGVAFGIAIFVGIFLLTRKFKQTKGRAC